MPKAKNDDEYTDEEIRSLRPNPKYVALGYFTVVAGETRVTPKGMAWLRRIYTQGEQVGEPSWASSATANLQGLDGVDDLAEHVRAVEGRRNELIAEAGRLSTSTFARLEEAGVPRASLDALARGLGAKGDIQFSVLLTALADLLAGQAETARTLASQWADWDARLSDLEHEGEARVLALEGTGGRAC